MTEKKEINVVLSGGSARGLSHIGVLSVLERHFKINSVIGTSMGAIIGGLYCYGYSPAEITDLVKETKPKKLFSIFKPSFSLAGLFDGNALTEYFEKRTNKVNIENCKVRFAAAAFDMLSSRTVLIDKGSLAFAMRASSSLPLIIEPFPYQKYLFVDGYIEHPLPLKFANHYGKMDVAASSVFPTLPQQSSSFSEQFADKDESEIPNMFDVFFRTTLYNQAALAIQSAITHKPAMYISTSADDLQFWDLDKVDEFVEIGEKAAGVAVEGYLKEQGRNVHERFFDNLAEKYREVSSYLKGFS